MAEKKLKLTILKTTGGEGLTGFKKVGGQAALDFGIKQAELNEKAIEEYE